MATKENTLQAKNNSVLLGIDPGTNLLGYGVIAVNGQKVDLEAMGVIDMRKCTDVYEKLGRIYERVSSLIASFHPTEMAIESPFSGVNIQSMLKLGRAQGVAIAAAVSGGLSINEYAPTKIKMALTGNGSASKEQVSGMLQKIFHLNEEQLLPYLDATDALAVAYCHYLQRRNAVNSHPYSGWNDFIKKNATRVSGMNDKLKCKK